MPYRRKYNKRKRTYRKKRQYRRKGPSTVMGPLSNRLKTTMIYHDSFTLDVGAAGTPAIYQFTANGLYDPNITGVGHQPRGFDQLTPLYDHYVVIGCKLTVTAQNTDTGNANILAMLVKDNTTALLSDNDILENRYVKYTTLAPEGSGPNTKSMTIKVNPNKFLGRSKPLADSELKGSSSANPFEQCFIQLYAIPMPGAFDTNRLYCRVRIEYTALWIEPKQPAQS